jgi:hypothetical protein
LIIEKKTEIYVDFGSIFQKNCTEKKMIPKNGFSEKSQVPRKTVFQDNLFFGTFFSDVLSVLSDLNNQQKNSEFVIPILTYFGKNVRSSQR